MNPIQMVDLKSQYQKIKNEINAGIAEVVESSAFINGPAVHGFQSALENYLSVKHVIPCGNGTDALQIAMMALGLKPGDEVITSAFTFIATAEVLGLLGLTPVFVDVEAHTFNMNVAEIEKAITPKTKAIVPVHLFGQCCDMEPLLDLAKKYNLFVTDEKLNNITFLTSEYNPNKDNYLELEAIDINNYVIKGNLWMQKKPFYYLHIDEKNKLYFDMGINDNIIKFQIN